MRIQFKNFSLKTTQPADYLLVEFQALEFEPAVPVLLVPALVPALEFEPAQELAVLQARLELEQAPVPELVLPGRLLVVLVAYFDRPIKSPPVVKY